MINFHKLFFVILYLCFISIVSSIVIEKNGYTGVSISFSDEIEEPNFKFENLKKVLQKSSEFLYLASKQRAYFKEFIIILPSKWKGGFCAESEYTREPPEKVNIYISNLPKDLEAQNSKGCGQEGDIIYMPLQWIEGSIEDLARRFVQEWSIYRYGVFEEIPLENGACHVSPKKIWSPVGCYDRKFKADVNISADGLPSCELPNEADLKELKSSLMFKVNNSKAFHFCDGSEDFPHNPVMPTLHNNLCEGKTVWSVIANSTDFRHGKNSPGKQTSPPNTSFKCYRERNIQLTFAVQSSSTSYIEVVVQELRYSLYRFIRNLIPKKSLLNLVTFSDSSDTTEAVTLNIEDDNQLFATLDKHIVATKNKSNACLLCGIQKALNASQFESHPSPIVIFIAWESALIGQKISQLVETIHSYPKVQLHLIFIEDTETDVVPTDLVNAVRSTGGCLHSLPKPLRRTNINKLLVPNILLYEQLNVILSAVVKSPLEVDDKIMVVHEATYKNGSSITDTFSTPYVTKGRLVYIMHCDLRNSLERDQNCSLWEEIYLTTFKCGTVTDLSNEKPKIWTYKFEPKYSIDNPVCSASAILYQYSSSTDSIYLRGWLNHYTITPEENTLIIYAEIFGSYQENSVQVIAQITGPGMDTPTEIELRDNGNGDPDIKSGDGIYSRYFISVKDKGTYAVTVTVKIATAKHSKIDANIIEPERIQRKVIGSFSVTSKLPDIDIFPPNRVVDLKVSHIDHQNSNVTLQWTAPGNDYDFGKAIKYEIKFATHPSSLMGIYFDSEESASLKETLIPQRSGEKEKSTFKFPREDQDSLYYVAVRAKDASDNRAKISNIVQVFLKGTKVIIPEATTGITATNNESITVDMNMTSTEDIQSSTIYFTTPDGNNTDVTSERSWQEIFSDTKFIIILSSAGGILLLLIIIDIIVCCCCMRKKNKPKTISKKDSLRPPHNMNVAYNHDSQSINRSESDLSASLKNFNDSNQFSISEGDTTPRFSYYTSKSIADKTKSESNTELGFKLVNTLPANTTRSLARFARRYNENEDEGESSSPVAQPQKPSNSNDAPIVYSLGRV